MFFVRQGATHKIVVGPVVAVANGYVPVTTLALTTADEAEAILHDNGTVVDISGYTWAAITTADGYYHLTLQSGISNTVGHVTIVVNDDSLCLPVKAEFTVVEEAVYDALYAASAPGYVTDQPVNVTKWLGTAAATPTVAGVPEVDVTHWRGTAAPAEHTSGYPIVTIKDGTGTGEINTNAGAIALVDLVTTTTTVTNQLTAAAIATGVWQDTTAGDFTVASSIGKALYIANIAPGAAGGHFIAGSNAGTTTVGALTVTGAFTAGTNALPWNAAYDAEVESEVNDALVANNLDHLLLSAVDTNFATTVHLDSVIGHLADAGGTATFDRTTDALEVLGAGVIVASIANNAITAAAIATGAIDADAIAADAITDAKVASDVTIASVTGAVGSVTGNVGGNVTGSVGSLAAQAKADVNAEVVDVLATDTYAEPGQGAPAATTTLAAKLNYLYKMFRNKKTQTATTLSLFADDASTVDQKATVSDDGTTTTVGEIASGP